MSARFRAPGPGIVLGGIGGQSSSRPVVGLLDFFDSAVPAGRMRRGYAVARSGYVLSLRITEDRAWGDVQGTQPTPFTASFRMRPLDPSDRAELVGLVARSPGTLGSLASGAVPSDLVDVLLPADGSDIEFDCSCPDEGRECKHAVALALICAQQIDRRPTDLLTLRGVSVEDVIESVSSGSGSPVGGHPGGGRTGPASRTTAGAPGDGEPFTMPRPLPPLPEPRAGIGTALESLDSGRLRRVLALWNEDPVQAESALQDVYSRVTEAGRG